MKHENRPFNVHLLYSNKFKPIISSRWECLCVKNDYDRILLHLFHTRILFALRHSEFAHPWFRMSWIYSSDDDVTVYCVNLLYIILLLAVKEKKKKSMRERECEKWSPFHYSRACFEWWQSAQLGNSCIPQSVAKSVQFMCMFVWLCDRCSVYYNIHILFMNYNFISFSINTYK